MAEHCVHVEENITQQTEQSGLQRIFSFTQNLETGSKKAGKRKEGIRKGPFYVCTLSLRYFPFQELYAIINDSGSFKTNEKIHWHAIGIPDKGPYAR